MDTGFIIARKPEDDPFRRLQQAFPDLMHQLLEQADADSPYLLYGAFTSWLLRHTDSRDQWRRAYQFFNELAESGDSDLENLMVIGIFEGLLENSAICADLRQHLGTRARRMLAAVEQVP